MITIIWNPCASNLQLDVQRLVVVLGKNGSSFPKYTFIFKGFYLEVMTKFFVYTFSVTKDGAELMLELSKEKRILLFQNDDSTVWFLMSMMGT